MEPCWFQSYLVPKGWQSWEITMLCGSRRDDLGWQSAECDSGAALLPRAALRFIYSKTESSVLGAASWSWLSFSPKADTGECEQWNPNCPIFLVVLEFLKSAEVTIALCQYQQELFIHPKCVCRIPTLPLGAKLTDVNEKTMPGFLCLLL